MEALRLADEGTPHVRIALAHHPIEWLAEWDYSRCKVRLLTSAHLFQRGHLHRPDVVVTRVQGRDCISVAAGSSHSSRHFENSYNIIELDFGDAVCDVRSFRFDPSKAVFEPEPIERVDLILGTDLPDDSIDWVEALEDIEEASAYAGYLAGLLIGYQDEIPVVVGDAGIKFLALGAARLLATPAEIEPIEAFLRLRNRLRLYDDELSVADRLSEHHDVVVDVSTWLTGKAANDAVFAGELARRTATVGGGMTRSTETMRPHAMAYLMELRNGEDWSALEEAARRHVTSPDSGLAVASSRWLVEALMHSEDGAKRGEAATLAAERAGLENASLDDVLLASGSAQLLGEDDEAVSFMLRAIEMSPGDDKVRGQARALATSTGDSRVLDAIQGARVD